MAKPQQPEIARSGRGATDPASAKSAPPADAVRVSGDTGPIPEDNLPGHHPEHEQDKPDVRLAAVPTGVRGDDDDKAGDGDRAGERREPDAGEPERTVAGEALRAAAGVVRKVRDALPGD